MTDRKGHSRGQSELSPNPPGMVTLCPVWSGLLTSLQEKKKGHKIEILPKGFEPLAGLRD